MTSVIVSTVESHDTVPPQNQNHGSSHYTLQWRRGQLLVKPANKVEQLCLPSLNDEQLLVDCLKRSPVNLVSIDGKLGETWLKFWAEACKKAHKPIFLSKPAHRKPPTPTLSIQSIRWLWRLIDWLVAFGLMLLVSPVLLGLVILMQIDSRKSLFTHEWRVGERGKIFRVIKLTPTQNHPQILQVWLKKSGLAHLPQLWNVLRGEMSLTGSACWTLEDAVRLSLAGQEQADKSIQNTLRILRRSTTSPTGRQAYKIQN
ncbi:sugar transferase [Trichormus variabilis ATCC 29413]|uniref:Sugar transferase n=2 Tax=Anabaena variabilis TaxID=264691 RepID=Q3ME45_TRIV2|nr:heterocyst development glycosyltransferase HepC [Trichormus variabilis]MBC1215768.1 sugar transferase [Trichormus variabilis ARAD]MBC1254844.1 sugar transferase [Trichormus variabilis V5]MBC1267710.1 sugar transferase [Trichormus variabilis FSR]MBC1304341.1 sugar transferase [Trichormus variabilis N2B]MBC1312797.1 sugar transferase [Trichormus variabilis PNB]MBC1327551.1 sugar transferase [Trichormus variabilis 9RC]MBD2379999.1 sugar transferase [Trichormus variabilis FACHB-319]QFZ14280.